MTTRSESGLRRLAARNGYRLAKSRRQDPLENCGEFMLIDCSINAPVLGFKYDADLNEIAEFLE
ncbi:hypothetical protein ACVIGB_006596 [Bradyrhizobium sp. USDA 4341]